MASRFPSPRTTLLLAAAIGGLLLGGSAALSAGAPEGEASCGANTTPVRWVDPEDPLLVGYRFDSVSSTQDEARRIAEAHDGRLDNGEEGTPDAVRTFCVTTGEQTNGRGTNGRVWMGQRGNVFVTIGIRQADWMASGIPLTLLPLRIGSLVAERVKAILDECPRGEAQEPVVTLKWPNDVLVNARKISGVLIESTTNGWFLVGIGVNLAYAPAVPTSGPNKGRASASLSEFCASRPDDDDDVEAAHRMGEGLARDLHAFLRGDGETVPTAAAVLEDWKRWIDWDADLVLRDTPRPETVRLANVLPDGRIEVRNTATGARRTLVSDYFF